MNNYSKSHRNKLKREAVQDFETIYFDSNEEDQITDNTQSNNIKIHILSSHKTEIIKDNKVDCLPASSNHSQDSSSSEIKSCDLNSDLAEWAAKHKIHQDASDSLLNNILRIKKPKSSPVSTEEAELPTPETKSSDVNMSNYRNKTKKKIKNLY